MEISLTDEFVRRYKLLPVSIQKKAEKQEKLFRQNPFHPSLHTEKLEPKASRCGVFVSIEVIGCSSDLPTARRLFF